MKSWPASMHRLILLLIAAGMLAGVFVVQRRMNALRTSHRLVDVGIADNAPPAVAFITVALGSFRGIAADLLWLYANRMQDQGNYFEIVQLASWMVKLQPRFTGATAYLAWNMAYNISVTFHDFEDRWRWVQRGIELIRDEALVYNPGDPELYKELGWIYQHKLGQELDDANRYYKYHLARQMMTCLGGWPPDWDKLSAAPPDATALAASLPNGQRLEEVLLRHGYDFRRLEKAFRAAEGALPAEVAADLQAERWSAGVETCLRARWLREVYKLDPVRIRQLNQEYGDLDWRLPEAHAIYWSKLGLNQDDDIVNLACERMIFQSLSNAFRGGRVAYMGSPESLEVTPNTSIVDAVEAQYLDSMAKHPGNTSIGAGYENFLIDAIVTLYSFGHERKAEEYFRKLRTKFNYARYRKPLEEFVLDEMAGDIATATFDQAHACVQAFLYRSFLALAVGDDDRANAYELVARRSYEKYMEQIGKSTVKRRGLPDFPDMKATMFLRCLETFPPELSARLRQAAESAGLDVGTSKGQAAPAGPPGTIKPD